MKTQYDEETKIITGHKEVTKKISSNILQQSETLPKRIKFMIKNRLYHQN